VSCSVQVLLELDTTVTIKRKDRDAGTHTHTDTRTQATTLFEIQYSMVIILLLHHTMIYLDYSNLTLH